MRVSLSDTAEMDVAGIYAYIAQRSPDQAERVVRAILSAAQGLAHFPLMGRAGATPGTRERLMTRYPYKIVYIITGDEIEVARVIHMAQDWP